MNKSLIKKHPFFVLIGYFFLLNIFQSLFMELTHDEAYYYFYSQNLAFGYYDHPPMVAVFIRMGTLIFGDNEFGVRIFFNFLQLGSMFYLWNLGGKSSPKLFALLLASFPLFVASGFLALPDTPLLFFSVALLYYVQKYKDSDSVKNSLLITLIISCAFYSKYHALLVVVLAVAANLDFLRRRSFWFIVIGVCLLYSPHIFWQYKHDFVSFNFHLKERSGTGFHLSNITEFLGSLVVLCGGLAVINILKASFAQRKSRLIYYNSLVFLLIIFLLSFRNKIEANWIVTASTLLIPLVCIFYEKRSQKWITRLLVPLFLVVLGFRYLLIKPEKDLIQIGLERLSEVKSWKRIAKEVEDLADGQKIYADTYQVAAKLSFYLKRPIHALHIRGRSSQYSLEPVILNENENITYVAVKKRASAIVIKTGYKDDLYIYKDKNLKEIKKALNR